MPMKIEVTVADVTVDDLYDELGKLREIGLGKSLIDWHTSRSHIGNQISMVLTNSDKKPDVVKPEKPQAPEKPESPQKGTPK